MGPSRSVRFQYERFGEHGFDDMPKGDFARIGVNPYTGKVVFAFNDGERYRDVVEQVINQLSRDLRRMRMVSGGAAGLHEFADVCDGKADMADFEPRVLAVGAAGCGVAAVGKMAS